MGVFDPDGKRAIGPVSLPERYGRSSGASKDGTGSKAAASRWAKVGSGQRLSASVGIASMGAKTSPSSCVEDANNITTASGPGAGG